MVPRIEATDRYWVVITPANPVAEPVISEICVIELEPAGAVKLDGAGVRGRADD
jgi:hypothetical protein